jgi:hypothetical protein
MRRVLILISIVFGLATVWFIGQRPAIQREWVTGVLLDDLRDRDSFTARVDAVCYGPQSTNQESTYNYFIVFLTKEDGGKLGVTDYKPGLHTLNSIRNLKVGSNYWFPEVLLRADTNVHSDLIGR